MKSEPKKLINKAKESLLASQILAENYRQDAYSTKNDEQYCQHLNTSTPQLLTISQFLHN